MAIRRKPRDDGESVRSMAVRRAAVERSRAAQATDSNSGRLALRAGCLTERQPGALSNVRPNKGYAETSPCTRSAASRLPASVPRTTGDRQFAMVLAARSSRKAERAAQYNRSRRGLCAVRPYRASYACRPHVCSTSLPPAGRSDAQFTAEADPSTTRRGRRTRSNGQPSVGMISAGRHAFGHPMAQHESRVAYERHAMGVAR